MVQYSTPYQINQTTYNQDYSYGTEHISFTNQGSARDIKEASSVVRQSGLGWLLPIFGQFRPKISGIIKLSIYTQKYAGNWPTGFV